jgi:hypothetical protein
LKAEGGVGHGYDSFFPQTGVDFAPVVTGVQEFLNLGPDGHKFNSAQVAGQTVWRGHECSFRGFVGTDSAAEIIIQYFTALIKLKNNCHNSNFMIQSKPEIKEVL